jgi:hypothetical protein
MADASMRVSDDDRERAVLALREHLLAGRLALEEFSERVEAALRAQTGGELTQAQEDLPDIFVAAPGSRDTSYSDIFRQLQDRQRQLPG